MLDTNCPSCGSPVRFKSEFSTHVTCSSCQNVLVRHDVNVELIGKVAELQPDMTVLQIGSIVTYGEQSFEVIGRLQILHQTGFWNEWHLINSLGESWWLGEAMGQFFLSKKVEIKNELLPNFFLGTVATIEGIEATAVNLASAVVNACEGELPFFMDKSYSYDFIDFKSTGTAGFTIQKEAGKTTLYQGYWLDYNDLEFANIKNPYAPPEHCPNPQLWRSVSKLNCKQCGAPFELHLGNASQSYVCPYCESSYDTSRPEVKMIRQTQSKHAALDLPIKIGDQFHYKNNDWRCTGFICKKVIYEGVNYPWYEYLFFSPHQGYRWLVQSENHWTWFEPMLRLPQTSAHSTHPVGNPESTYKSTNYHVDDYGPFLHFSTSRAIVTNVFGEFYWRVEHGMGAANHDYIAPPYMLSCEESNDELFWSAGTYVPVEELERLLPDNNFTPPLSTSIAPCQPNPREPLSRATLKMLAPLLILLFVIAGFQLYRGGTVATFQEAVEPGKPLYNQVNEFDFDAKAGMKITLRGSGIKYDYCSITAILIHQESQQQYKVESGLTKRYPTGEIFLSAMPKGRYTLAWNTLYQNYNNSKNKAKIQPVGKKSKPSLANLDPNSCRVHFTVKKSYFDTKLFFVTLLILLVILLLPYASSRNIESLRWSESDHASSSGGGGGGGDGENEESPLVNLVIFIIVIIVIFFGE